MNSGRILVLKMPLKTCKNKFAENWGPRNNLVNRWFPERRKRLY